MESERNEMIEALFNKGYTQKEMCSFLKAHGYHLSERHLRRILLALGLQRRCSERPFDEIQQAVESELRHWSPGEGIRAMHKKVRDGRGVRPCYRNDVLQIMRDLDASGLERRQPGKRKIQRRNYCCCGPNDIWHIDGNDKLKFFGIWLHLCVDGFSRKIIWLKAGTSNRRQTFVARYFLDAVKEHNGCPRRVRADRGLENLVVGQMQVAFHTPLHASAEEACSSFLVGKSVHNQRAECFNSFLKKTWIKKWQNHFEALMEADQLDLDDPVHINCLQYTHLPLIQDELYMERMMWNNHNIRKQHNARGPFGKPDHLFYAPPLDSINMLTPVDECLRTYAEHLACDCEEPSLVATQEFRDIAGEMLLQYDFPNTAVGVANAYLVLKDEFANAFKKIKAPRASTFSEANLIYEQLVQEGWR